MICVSTVTGERGARLGSEENTATRLRQLLTLPGGREEEEGAGAGMTAGIESRGENFSDEIFLTF